ncbi:TonB-dependent receptor [Occallatibacter savannae]|uniref:TonB-dependent receptor n=1 Tax=Occallatibacter savannae TaxID=1002691 RepID=UPI000D68F8F9|nr:TonB-dependent receptor [Occallatibacter savannae]
MLRRLLAGIAFASCIALAANAQIAADLRGRVLDPAGSAVPNATVDLTQSATNTRISTLTSRSGDYSFTNLTPGVYQLDVNSPGFAHLTRGGVRAIVGQTVNVDLRLTLTTSQQTVKVNSDAPLLQSATSNIQTNIPGSTVVAMPLNTRNFVQLATLSPGVELPPGTVLPRINGGRPRTNEYLYDGISALQPEPGQVVYFPIVDDIQAFTVEADNVPAEFGRFNGGVVNVATRSGTNRLHGTLFEFFRNEDLNARNYFAAAAARKPEYRRNLYGGTIGGPILPNHLFFFGAYQGIKQLIGVTRISTIPTMAERQGIFTGLSHIYDPTTTTVVNGITVRREFPNDVISIPFDPAAQALLARFPTPTNLTAKANNYTRTANDADHQNQFDFRIDGSIGSHDIAFGRFSYYNEIEQPVAPLPDGSGAINGAVIGTGGVSGLSSVLGQQAVINETHIFTPHLLADLRAGYTRRGNNINGASLKDTASASLSIPGIPTNAAFNNALPLFTFSGFQQLGPSPSTFSQYQTAVWQTVDNVAWTRGPHQLKFGLDFRWYQLNAIAPPNPTGSFAFTTTGTNQQGVTNSGNSIASFLLGQVDTFQIDLQQSQIRPRDHIFEFFAQDDWKLTGRLTLNVGARYTLHFPSTEKTNQGAVFNLATQQLDYLGRNGFSRSARELHYDNLAPRIGFAFLATPKAVLRSGFGIVFIDQSGITTPFTTPQFPFIQNVQQKTQDNLRPAFVLSHGPSVAPIPLTPDAGLGQSVYTADRRAGSGYSQQWNLAIQRAITSNLSAEVAYVGSHIVHVGVPDSNLNQLTADQLAQGASLLQAVPNPYYGQIPSSSSLGGRNVTRAQLLKPYPRFLNVATYRHNSGQSNYNALEAKVEQRLSHGISFLFAYTHSKLIDDASAVFSTTVLSSPNSSSLIAADSYRPSLERDSSSGDMPNVTSFSATYDLPAGHGHSFASHGLSDTVLGGWQLNTILSLQSGMPVTITQATNFNSFAGFSIQRPNLIGKPSLSPAERFPSHFFNTAAFATAPQFTIGSASRNPVRGPAYRDLDLALVKHTTLFHETGVEFRAELFNVTNTPAFAQPNGGFGSPAFGSITSTVTDPRVMQLAIRLSR